MRGELILQFGLPTHTQIVKEPGPLLQTGPRDGRFEHVPHIHFFVAIGRENEHSAGRREVPQLIEVRPQFGEQGQDPLIVPFVAFCLGAGQHDALPVPQDVFPFQAVDFRWDANAPVAGHRDQGPGLGVRAGLKHFADRLAR